MDIRIIAPITRDCVIGDQILKVRGISLRNCAALLVRFPAVLGYLTDRAIEPAALLTNLPDAALAIMAAGLGETGNAETEKQLDDWNFAEQATLLNDVLDLTFAGDKALPFVRAIVATAARSSDRGDPSGEPQQPGDQPISSETTQGSSTS